MRVDRPLTIVFGWRRWGKCRYCGELICWVMTAPHGSKVPFDNDPLVLAVEEHPVTQVKFEHVSREKIHFATCRHKAKRQAERPRRRSWGGVR